MNTKNNQRYIKPEEKIDSALSSLLKQKPLRRITVRDICKTAQIHHTTFYEHYLDIFDLIEKKEQQMGIELRERVENSRIMANNTTVSLSIITAVVEYVKENKYFYTSYLNDFGVSSVNTGFDMVWSIVEKIIFDNEEILDYKEIKYAFEFCKAGILKVILYWLNNDCYESVKEISKILFRLLVQLQSPYSSVFDKIKV